MLLQKGDVGESKSRASAKSNDFKVEHEEDPVDVNNDQVNEVVVITEDNRDTSTDEEESQEEFYDEENKSDCSE